MSRPISQAAILARGSEMRHKFCNLLEAAAAAAAVAPANSKYNRSDFAYLSRNAKPAITQPQSQSQSQPCLRLAEPTASSLKIFDWGAFFFAYVASISHRLAHPSLRICLH